MLLPLLAAIARTVRVFFSLRCLMSASSVPRRGKSPCKRRRRGSVLWIIVMAGLDLTGFVAHGVDQVVRRSSPCV